MLVGWEKGRENLGRTSVRGGNEEVTLLEPEEKKPRRPACGDTEWQLDLRLHCGGGAGLTSCRWHLGKGEAYFRRQNK